MQHPGLRVRLLLPVEEAHRLVAEVVGRVLPGRLRRRASHALVVRVRGEVVATMRDRPLVEEGWIQPRVPIHVAAEDAAVIAGLGPTEIGLQRVVLVEHIPHAAVVLDHRVVGVEAAEERGTAGTAEGCRADGLREPCSTRRQVAAVRAAGEEPLLQLRHHVERALGALVVGEEDQDVRLAQRHRGVRRCGLRALQVAGHVAAQRTGTGCRPSGGSPRRPGSRIAGRRSRGRGRRPRSRGSGRA